MFPEDTKRHKRYYPENSAIISSLFLLFNVLLPHMPP